MKELYDRTSYKCSKVITKNYSTSFSLAVNLLAPSIREAIHSIYGFVRIADEIVDSFHDFEKKILLDHFENEYYTAYNAGISLNPIINSFQRTVKKYHIEEELVAAFIKSMRWDLEKQEYNSVEEYEKYIYGSADVVGLMCLKVFVNGDKDKYDALKDSAMKLGSAFQKVNFLRDLKADVEILNRSYFPGVNLKSLDKNSKQQIVAEIEEDFRQAYSGIKKLPLEARLGVYTAYIYYKQLLNKLKQTPSEKIMDTRIRISNPLKISLLAKSFLIYKLNLM